ncbi:hypothetical protein SSS_02847 [Sarcoptes scabiei]|uniref:Uncharacterized protein n=2 Tax=Sarcoptes scabiei TaxID=52283 RepID=A0A834R6G1_SARSC|nr:hypothetical protein SSS_02847 [Sarcoptes scabiei]
MLQTNNSYIDHTKSNILPLNAQNKEEGFIEELNCVYCEKNIGTAKRLSFQQIRTPTPKPPLSPEHRLGAVMIEPKIKSELSIDSVESIHSPIVSPIPSTPFPRKSSLEKNSSKKSEDDVVSIAKNPITSFDNVPDPIEYRSISTTLRRESDEDERSVEENSVDDDVNETMIENLPSKNDSDNENSNCEENLMFESKDDFKVITNYQFKRRPSKARNLSRLESKLNLLVPRWKQSVDDEEKIQPKNETQSECLEKSNDSITLKREILSKDSLSDQQNDSSIVTLVSNNLDYDDEGEGDEGVENDIIDDDNNNDNGNDDDVEEEEEHCEFCDYVNNTKAGNWDDLDNDVTVLMELADKLGEMIFEKEKEKSNLVKKIPNNKSDDEQWDEETPTTIVPVNENQEKLPETVVEPYKKVSFSYLEKFNSVDLKEKVQLLRRRKISVLKTSGGKCLMDFSDGKNTYQLQTKMSLNEASCLVNTCRKQLPRYPPEPYTILRPTSSTNDVYNHNGLNNYEEFNGSFPSDHNNHLDFNHEENHGHEDLSSDDSNSMTIAQEQTQKVRKPAKFFLGKPQKIHSSIRPLLFG